jgi:phosphoribosylamine-glycine ligase
MFNNQTLAVVDKQVKTFGSSNKESLSGLTEYVMPMSHFGRVAYDNGASKFVEGGKNLWILKPVGLNRGQGIHVVDSIKKCKKIIKQYCFGKEEPQKDKEKTYQEPIKCT